MRYFCSQETTAYVNRSKPQNHYGDEFSGSVIDYHRDVVVMVMVMLMMV